MKEKKTILQKVPVIIIIMTIILLSLFALDSFNPKYTLWEQLKGFFIHLVPSLLLLAILIFTWRRRLIGGILFILIGCAGGVFLFQHNMDRTHTFIDAIIPPLVLAFPFIVAGSLFVFNHFRKKKIKE